MSYARVEKVENGYIVTDKRGNQRVIFSTEELFNHLLLMFEGLSSTFQGDKFGHIEIKRSK